MITTFRHGWHYAEVNLRLGRFCATVQWIPPISAFGFRAQLVDGEGDFHPLLSAELPCLHFAAYWLRDRDLISRRWQG